MEIDKLYCTPIGRFKIDNYEKMNLGLLELVYSMRNLDAKNIDQYSMAGPTGYHTSLDLLKHDNKYISQFKKHLASQVAEYYVNLTGKNLYDDRNAYFTSWGMIYGAGDYSKIHTHPKADLAVAYYIKVPKHNNSIEGSFSHIDPRPAARWDNNFMGAIEPSINPNEGEGIIFPGWLEHYVNPHQSDEDRVCIATNVFITNE